MGFGNLPIGLSGAVTLVTVPQLLAAQGTPESAIALVTTVALIAGFTNFLLAPVLDWRLSRRTYAIIMALLGGILSFVLLLQTRDLELLAVLVLLQSLAAYLNQAAVGGWLSSVTSPEQKNALGAWLQAANVAAFGVGAGLAILLIRNLPPGLGAGAVGLLSLVPIPIYLAIPAPPANAKLGHESFRAFLRDVFAVLRRPTVRWLLFFLVMPAASFALSNTLSGLGGDFGASEEMVGAVSGVGVAIAGIVGALLVPPIIRGFAVDRAYLLIGAVGAASTLLQIALPRIPATFALGMIGQNGIQAAAFAAVNVLTLRSIPHNHPLAATQYALLMAVSGLPLAYMQAIDGAAYGHGGLTASYLADALISLSACAVLAMLLWRRRARAGVEASGVV
ncbi:MAG TPA: MFS transporter [Alphaproteobacteria bacterium]|nr:MFS transporter [Alphaproteobacteria bacterium]